MRGSACLVLHGESFFSYLKRPPKRKKREKIQSALSRLLHTITMFPTCPRQILNRPVITVIILSQQIFINFNLYYFMAQVSMAPTQYTHTMRFTHKLVLGYRMLDTRKMFAGTCIVNIYNCVDRDGIIQI